MYVAPALAQRGVCEKVLVCVREGRGVGCGFICGARRCVTEEAVCESPWDAAGEGVKVGFEGGC